MTASYRRKQVEAGWGPPKTDDSGKVVCRRCSGDIPRGRKTFCKKECVHEWRLRTDPGYVRLKVFERDQGVCAECGLDVFKEAFRWNGPASARTRRARSTGDLWQADHIVPVAEGGGECGIENYRTLCTACHKIETAKLRRRLSGAKP